MHRPALPVLLLLTLCAACNPTISFDASVKGTANVQGSPLGGGVLSGPLNLAGLNNISLSQSANLQNQNTDKDHIDHVTIKTLTLKVTRPTPGDLSFLKSLSLSISSPKNSTPKRIAHLESFPVGTNPVTMTLDGVDLAPYAKDDSMSITADATGSAPASDTTIEAEMVMTIDAHVL